jgi:hypothetical protein
MTSEESTLFKVATKIWTLKPNMSTFFTTALAGVEACDLRSKQEL